MRLSSPYVRIQELIGLIDLDPTIVQMVRFLSGNLDPTGEIAGLTWMTLDSSGFLVYHCTYGLHTTMDPNVKVSLSDDNPVAVALRTGRTQLFDMSTLYDDYAHATHEKELSHYSTGMALPISGTIVLGAVFTTTRRTLKPYDGYFECIRLVLSLWRSRLAFNQSTLASASSDSQAPLTERQVAILDLIQSGATNGSIAMKLGYSESLIRQETVIIYRKLGVQGRKEILAKEFRKSS